MKFLKKLPPEVRALVAPGDRLLAWCMEDPDGLVVASSARLVATGLGVDVSWVEVLSAAWDEPILELTLWGQGHPQARTLHLRKAGVLPQVVRERTMQSLLVQQHVALFGERGVRLLARRDPVSDVTFWQRIYDSGVNPTDPATKAEVEAAQAELSITFGVGGVGGAGRVPSQRLDSAVGQQQREE